MSFWSRLRGIIIPLSPAKPRPWFIDPLHVFVLFNFAVAQPIYDRLSGRAALFVDQSIGMSVAYILAAWFTCVIPAAVVLLEAVIRRWHAGCYEVVHRLFIGLMLLLIALPILERTHYFPSNVVIVLALLATGLGSWSYWKYPAIQTIVTWASLGIVIFPLTFLLQFSGNFAEISSSSHRTERWNPVPVVVLVLDEFCGSSLMTPEREIDAQRFPNFAALSKTTTWFRNATTVNHATVQALPALLSGCYPKTSSLPVPGNLPQNLFSELSATDAYDMAVFEPVSVLARPRSENSSVRSQGLWSQSVFVTSFLWRVYLFHIVPYDYQQYLPRIPRLWFGWHETGKIDFTKKRGVFRYGWSETRDIQFQHWMNCLYATDKPTLYFGHLLLPHIPWCYLPSGSCYAQDGEDWQLRGLPSQSATTNSWGQDELEVVNNQQRYLLQLVYVDKLVGKFIARLKETGLYDRCLLIVTGDHGLSFRSNETRRSPTPQNLDEILSIPLFIKLPGQQVGGHRDQPVESVDIFPTICDVLGLKLGRPTDGWSIFDDSRPQRTRKTFGDFKSLSTIDPEVITKSTVPLQIRERFGDPADPLSLYQINQIPELIGRRVDSLKQTTEAPVEMEFLRYDDSVKSVVTKTVTKKTVPCFFEGLLASKTTSAAPMVVAVAVNGTIQAVTRTYRQVDAPSRLWSAMVPEPAFHEGRNDVRFYKVTGVQPDWTLTPCISVRPGNPRPGSL